METFMELGIVKETTTGQSAIYIKVSTTERHVFDNDQAKLMVLQMVKFINEVDELNAGLETPDTLQ
jgi:hypothetical protein